MLNEHYYTLQLNLYVTAGIRVIMGASVKHPMIAEDTSASAARSLGAPYVIQVRPDDSRWVCM